MPLGWIQVDANLASHRKSLHLAALLRDRRAWTYLVQMWGWASQNEPTGLIRGAAAELVLEQVAGWDGEPGAFAKAALAAGWIDAREDGLYIHDWHDHQGAHIAKAQKDAERKRQGREDLARRFGVPGTSGGHPKDGAENPSDGAGKKKTNTNTNSLSSKEKETAPPALELTPEEPEKPAADEAREVFEYWVQVRQLRHAKFTRDRERKVRARLAEGYSAAELKRAVDGNAASAWHREKQQHDLELICRDGTHVDRFLREAGQAAAAESPEMPPEVQQPDTPAGKAWAAALGRLRDGGQTFSRGWLERLEAVALRGHELELRAADACVLDWFREHYGGFLADLLAVDGLTPSLTAPEEAQAAGERQ